MNPEQSRASSADYHEQLGVPLRWWAVATMFLASMLLAFLIALPAAVAYAATAAMLVAVVALFLGYGAAVLEVRHGEFRAGRAAIPLLLLGTAKALDATEARRAAGVEADARAYLLLRPYLAEAVKVPVRDPADPTPYWLVSTRHPDRLVAALGAATEGRD